MKKYLISFIGLLAICSSTYAAESVLFDIKSFCRMPAPMATNNLPVEKELFDIEEIENPKYGHEEIWLLNNKQALRSLGLKMLRIEVHQGKIQSVWFKNDKSGLSDSMIFEQNLMKVGLKENELKEVMSEHKVNNKDGYVIRILGNGDYHQCFEYHAGH